MSQMLLTTTKKWFLPQITTKNLIKWQHTIKSHQNTLMARGLPKRKPIDNVKNIILVSSGKGGVGKSTISVNLAVSLKQNYPEKSFGLLDCDIFGPTVPLMMNLNESPLLTEKNLMVPLVNYGVKCMSMGFLVQEGSPVIWRGLMVMQAIERLTRQVEWQNIDCLIIDTPPGTGDTHLSLVQNLPINGVILVTTPQTAALQVTKRGAIMYRKLEVPIVGLVENMSQIQCPKCHEKISIFGEETQKLLQELNIKLLCKFGLKNNISQGGDEGVPIVISQPDCEDSKSFKMLANSVLSFLK